VINALNAMQKQATGTGKTQKVEKRRVRRFDVPETGMVWGKTLHRDTR
jgi:hypothetical protein